MDKKKYIIKITGKQGDYLHITDLENRYQGKIDESLIPVNNYQIIDNKVEISESCFKHWFKDDIEAEAKRIRDDIEAEAKRIRQENFDLFYKNIPLFWKHREMIMKEPRFYSVMTPEYFFGAMGTARATLGKLLQIWTNLRKFSCVCKKCGGQAVTYQFGGSPLSGCLFVNRTVCLQCGEFGEGQKGTTEYSFHKLHSSSNFYKCPEPIAENPASYQELVDACLCVKRDYSAHRYHNNEETVQAIRYQGPRSLKAVREFCGDDRISIPEPRSKWDGSCIILKDNEVALVSRNDYIVRKEGNAFRKVDATTFNATYKLCDDKDLTDNTKS